jgi:FkbH-like protein
VVNVPSEPAEYINALQRGLWFESGAVTEEDKRRSALYQAQAYSREAREQSGSVEEYLQSLQMTASVCPISEADLPRIVQMLGKTNQFNLTTRRHGLAEVREILQSPGGIGFSLRLRDRFADHGLVALLLAKASDESASEKTLVIDSFLMSCRVIGRTVEGYFIRTLAQHAVKAGFVRLEGEYIPSPKNQLVALLFEKMGFERIRETEGGGSVCCLQLPAAIWPRTFVSNGS